MKRLVLGLAVGILGCLASPSIVSADDAEDHFNRGVAWANKGEYEKAIAEYNQSMQSLDPNDPNNAAHIASVCNTRGKALNHKGENDKAIADYNQCLAVDPEHASAYTDLAFLRATCPDEKYRDGKKAAVAFRSLRAACPLDGGQGRQLSIRCRPVLRDHIIV